MMLIALLSRSSGPSKLGGKGHWGECPPPDFGKYVNPISNRGDDYAYCITTAPFRFLDLPTALNCTLGIKSTALFHNIQINQEEPCDRHVRVLLDASS